MALTLKFVVALGISCLLAGFSVTEGKPQHVDAECTTQPYRLRYHFSPKENWMNDPNGLVYYDGVYHLFYQYHPGSIQDGPKHWGHAISSNMVVWEDIGIALFPDEHGHIWSGSAVVDYGNTTGFQSNPDVHPLVAIFTSTGERGQRQSIAYSIDKGRTFTKYEANPVLTPPEGTPDFRDPKVFLDPTTGKWTMVLAVGNHVEFFRSEDLKTWSKLSEFGQEEGEHGGVWECSDLVQLPTGEGDKKVWALIVSVAWGGPNGGFGAQYFVGDWNGERFTPFHPWHPTQWVDMGPDNYAGVTWNNDPQGRAIFLGWMVKPISQGAVPTPTWRGQMTMPRQLSIHTVDASANQYRVRSRPPQEMESLRHPLQHIEHSQEFTVLPHSTVTLTDQAVFKNPLMEIVITVEMQNDPQFSICAYNTLGEEVCVGHDDRRWFVDRRKSGNIGFDGSFEHNSYSSAERLVNDEQVTIRMFVDTTSVELFADDGLTILTSLFFPTEPLDRVYIHHWSEVTRGATLKVKKLDIWGLVCGVQD